MTNKEFIDINSNNVDEIYRDFESRVIKDKRINTIEKIRIFLGTITNDENYYCHPRKKNTLMFPLNSNESIIISKEAKIDTEQYNAFKEQFNPNMTSEQKCVITSICVKLLEDEKKRLNGGCEFV